MHTNIPDSQGRVSSNKEEVIMEVLTEFKLWYTILYMMCFDLLKLMRSLKQLRDLLGCNNLYLKMIV